jgi:hypothetical protein
VRSGEKRRRAETRGERGLERSGEDTSRDERR